VTDRVFLRQGDDKKVSAALKDMAAGNVSTVITAGINPVYSLPGFAEAAAKVSNRISMTDRMDETAEKMQIVLPVHHFLESWGDFYPKKKVLAMAQPTINPLFDTRQTEDILLQLSGSTVTYSDYLKSFYAEKLQPKTGLTWNEILQNGVIQRDLSQDDYFMTEAQVASIDNLKMLVIQALVESSLAMENINAGSFEMVFYQKAGLGNGNQANNPWLHELPDPVTRISWDNYVTVSAADASALGIVNAHESNGALNGSYVKLTANDMTLDRVPAFIQPGQAQGTLGLSVGFGRTAAGKAGNNIGVNAYALNGGLVHWNTDVSVEVLADQHPFASVQLGHTMMGRKIVNEVSLADFLNENPHNWNHKHQFATYKGPLSSNETNLWDDHDHETLNMWNMSIDLNSCIGCGACVVACHLENNVPVVGKEEVRKHRDMHWLRIDRYYSSDMNDAVAEAENVGGRDKYLQMEKASENPEVVFQPVMCQHCNHAPCETVCPVAATTHSREGLNHMTYNRCIGTRYCANNCPYKVRRFNWFNYKANNKFAEVNPAQDDFGRMVLNPDVTVRSRGVMEKCTMCIQRIQFAKLEAKKKNGKVADGMFVSACAQACPTGAITVGDVNDKGSAVSALKADDRAYHLLEEIGTQPSVFYQTKVRNKA
jgi:molybdopterin-containing oxidoreductase family iron-sulfur binding subunit